ncbi:MAG: polysaccharide pyruvyl transferase CsaB [Cyanobacteriota bacterium]
MARSVLLCGYYGEHNLGDDALLESLLGQLPASVTPLVTAYDQPMVEARHGVATVQRRSLGQVLRALSRCRALVLGGGSLLQDSTSFRSLVYYAALILAARLQGQPVLLWAQGLGPLRRRRSRLLARLLLPLATAISWRDAASARLARQLGCSAPHGADAVWALPPQPWIGRGGPVVVCWRPTALVDPAGWSVLLQALEQLAESQNRQVLWLPFHGAQDQPLLHQLIDQGLVPPALQRRSRQIEAQTPSEAMAVFRSAGLVVAMRLHALILAALSGAPVAALSYDPKVQACAVEFGCGCTDLADPMPPPADLAATWGDALDQPAGLEPLAQMRQATALHRTMLERLAS